MTGVQTCALPIYWFDAEITFMKGGDGQFDVNNETGDVFIVGRQMFNVGQVYQLAISAQVVGTAVNRTSTPTQVLNVQVGYRRPQFYMNPYNISIDEGISERF